MPALEADRGFSRFVVRKILLYNLPVTFSSRRSGFVTSVAARVPHWTLTNYLRSDIHYYRYQFSLSLDTVASRGYLEAVKWLFTHANPVSVVGAAVEMGHLSVVQYLWTQVLEADLKEKAVPVNG
ncbi:hypothetical protein PC120_g10088 [Phytophthora cactorum]|nr:hypothetical protein PC120_g10088 [Phytophthora cactorum]